LDGLSPEDGWNPLSKHTLEGELNHRIGFISMPEISKMYLITLTIPRGSVEIFEYAGY